MSQRPKLDMEETFRRIIPDAARFGTKFVFRQGSPLVPDALRRVAATAASSLIVVGDSSRCAQSVAHKPVTVKSQVLPGRQRGVPHAGFCCAVLAERSPACTHASVYQPTHLLPAAMPLLRMMVPWLEALSLSSLCCCCCRSAEEADAQSLRTAILLDELDFPGGLSI